LEESEAQDRIAPEALHWHRLRPGKPINQRIYQQWGLGECRANQSPSSDADGISPAYSDSNIFMPSALRLRASKSAVE
jgi:hypothetical protein